MLNIFGLEGFLNAFVSFLIFLLLTAIIIVLLLPTIFRYLVSPLFDGSYNFKKDKITTTEKITPQNNYYTLQLNKEKYSFNREVNDKRIRTEKLILPVDENGKPHWDYMSKFMQKIEAEKLEKALEYIYIYI